MWKNKNLFFKKKSYVTVLEMFQNADVLTVAKYIFIFEIK